MSKVFFVKNDWDDKTLSAAGTWVNDGRDPMHTEADASERINDYLRHNPDDNGRLFIVIYDCDDED